MLIKSYKLFLERMIAHKNHTGTDYEYGCVLAYLDFGDDLWESIINRIDDADLYQPEQERYGKETEPHVTILYGLHKEVTDEDVKDSLSKLNGSELIVKCSKIECFKAKDFDV